MNAAVVFGVMAAVQALFLLLLFVFLLVRRRYDRQRRAAYQAGQAELAALMEQAGFGQVSYQNLSGGVVAIHRGARG